MLSLEEREIVASWLDDVGIFGEVYKNTQTILLDTHAVFYIDNLIDLEKRLECKYTLEISYAILDNWCDPGISICLLLKGSEENE